MKGMVKGTAGCLSIPRADGGPRVRLAVAAAAVVVVLLSGLLGSYPASAQDQGAESGICGRTEAVRDAILDELSQVSDCADVTDSDLRGITGTIHLSAQSSLTLQAGDFAGMAGLDVLYLDSNSLTSVPDGALSGLSTLRELYLHSNSLTTLSSDVFDGLTSLEKLQLSHNNLTSLPADVFDDVRFLSRLNLSNNSLSSLPNGIFDGVSALLELQLTDNPGAPFPFTADLELTDDGGVVVKVADGAPFEMTVALSAVGGTLSSTPVTVDAGSTTSSPVTVTPSGTDDVVVSVDSADLTIDNRHSYAGIQAGTGDSLTIAVNSPPTGAPTISGTAQVGETLTADTSGIADADGLTDTAFSYQWLSGDTVIDNATGSTYVLQSTDVTNTITVTVTFTDDEGNAETLTSAATAAVAAANSPASGAPTISGTAQVGETLTADTSGITDANGLTDVAFSYQWLSGDTAIDGATGSTYVLQSSDATKTITVTVSFTDDEGNVETLTSAATAAVAAAVNSPASGAPTISGTAQVGHTLTADTSGITDADGLTDVTFSYQWLADDTVIDNATGSTYVLQASDATKTIKVTVTFTDDGGNAETLTSEATAAVGAGGL